MTPGNSHHDTGDAQEEHFAFSDLRSRFESLADSGSAGKRSSSRGNGHHHQARELESKPLPSIAIKQRRDAPPRPPKPTNAGDATAPSPVFGDSTDAFLRPPPTLSGSSSFVSSSSSSTTTPTSTTPSYSRSRAPNSSASSASTTPSSSYRASSPLDSQSLPFAISIPPSTSASSTLAPPETANATSGLRRTPSGPRSFADLRSRFEGGNSSNSNSNGSTSGRGQLPATPDPTLITTKAVAEVTTPRVSPAVPLPSSMPSPSSPSSIEVDAASRRSSAASTAHLSNDVITAVNWAESSTNDDEDKQASHRMHAAPSSSSLDGAPSPQQPVPIPPPVPSRSHPSQRQQQEVYSRPLPIPAYSARSVSNPNTTSPSARAASPLPPPAKAANMSLSPPSTLPPLLRSASSGSSVTRSATNTVQNRPIPPPVPSRTVADGAAIPASSRSLPPAPPRRASPALHHGSQLHAPPPPMLRSSRETTTTMPTPTPSIPRRPVSQSNTSSSDEDSGEEAEEEGQATPSNDIGGTPDTASSPDMLPDASRANRRPPNFFPPRTARSKHFHCFAVSGHTVCTASGDKVRVYRVGSTARNGETGDKMCSLAAEHGGKETKITSMAFRPGPAGASTTEPSRFLWCGTREGSLCEMDIATATVVNTRHNVHTAAVVRLERAGSHMLSMDESGKICTWIPSQPGESLSLSQQPIAQRVALEKSTVVVSVGHQLWASSGGGGPSTQTAAFSATVRSLGNSSHHTNGVGATVGSPPSSSLSPLSPPSLASGAGPRIRIFNPFSITMPFNATSRPLTMSADTSRAVGAVTCGTVIPAQANLVYLGHESGYVSVWDRTKMSCLRVQRLSSLAFTAIVGVGEYLWTGNRSGRITIYTCQSGTGAQAWRVIKSWPAHKGPVSALYVDSTSLEVNDGAVPLLQVASAGLDYNVQLWDGFLNADWLSNRVSARSKEFSTHRSIRTLHVSFNIDASTPLDLQTSADAMNWLPDVLTSSQDSPPHIIYFGFQEVVDLEDKRLTAKSMIWNAASGGKKARAKAKFRGKLAKDHAQDAASNILDVGDQHPQSHDSAAMNSRITLQYRMWYDRLVSAVRLAMPPDCPYRVVHSENLVGLFTCTLMRSDEWSNASDVAMTTVKTGLGGRWGNKGAIVSRLVLDDTSCCFINAHLAAGQKHVKQRNQDIADIMECESLPTSATAEKDIGGSATADSTADATAIAYVGGGAGELILDHEVVFFSGDLNYRIDLPRSHVLQGITAGGQDDRRRLYERDQLYNQLTRGGPMFRLRGFQEAQWATPNGRQSSSSSTTAPPFWPTYKFDPGTTNYDTSEKNRIPAWCDRILFRCAGAHVRTHAFTSWPNVTISDHRPISAVFDVQVKKVDPVKRSVVEEQERGALRERVQSAVEWAREYYRNCNGGG